MERKARPKKLVAAATALLKLGCCCRILEDISRPLPRPQLSPTSILDVLTNGLLVVQTRTAFFKLRCRRFLRAYVISSLCC